MRQSRYKLLLTGLDLVASGPIWIKKHVNAWAAQNGVRNVSSGVVRCDADLAQDVMLYSAHFDSSHWTGRGFEGFDHKNPGVRKNLLT